MDTATTLSPATALPYTFFRCRVAPPFDPAIKQPHSIASIPSVSNVFLLFNTYREEFSPINRSPVNNGMVLLRKTLMNNCLSVRFVVTYYKRSHATTFNRMLNPLDAYNPKSHSLKAHTVRTNRNGQPSWPTRELSEPPSAEPASSYSP